VGAFGLFGALTEGISARNTFLANTNPLIELALRQVPEPPTRCTSQSGVNSPEMAMRLSSTASIGPIVSPKSVRTKN
jgi:hypothetical protein